MGRELFVVARDHPDRYRFFVETFTEAPTVQVIWDRRFGERRRTSVPVVLERRREDRRCRSISAELQTTGYAFIAHEEPGRPIPR